MMTPTTAMFYWRPGGSAEGVTVPKDTEKGWYRAVGQWGGMEHGWSVKLEDSISPSQERARLLRLKRRTKFQETMVHVWEPWASPSSAANPATGLAQILITVGLTAVGVLGIVMGVSTIRQSPPMPPPTI